MIVKKVVIHASATPCDFEVEDEDNPEITMDDAVNPPEMGEVIAIIDPEDADIVMDRLTSKGHI
jgi:hypothetical protein